MQNTRRSFFSVIAAAAVSPLPAAPPTWRAAPFRIVSSVGTRIVDGYVFDCFGIRQYSEGRVDSEWNVTHIPTGYSLGLTYQTKHEAMRAVERIAATGDWSHIDGQKHPDVKRLGPIVIALRKEYGDA
jgi:hypothetical protein